MDIIDLPFPQIMITLYFKASLLYHKLCGFQTHYLTLHEVTHITWLRAMHADSNIACIARYRLYFVQIHYRLQVSHGQYKWKEQSGYKSLSRISSSSYMSQLYRSLRQLYRKHGNICWAKYLQFQPCEVFRGNTFAVHWPLVLIVYL